MCLPHVGLLLFLFLWMSCSSEGLKPDLSSGLTVSVVVRFVYPKPKAKPYVNVQSVWNASKYHKHQVFKKYDRAARIWKQFSFSCGARVCQRPRGS